jgi:hypothetical protein
VRYRIHGLITFEKGVYVCYASRYGIWFRFANGEVDTVRDTVINTLNPEVMVYDKHFSYLAQLDQTQRKIGFQIINE